MQTIIALKLRIDNVSRETIPCISVIADAGTHCKSGTKNNKKENKNMRPIYYIHGISYETLKALHDFYLPRTIITSTYFDKISKLYDVNITPNSIIKVNDGDITLDLGAKLYTIENNKFIKVVIE